MFIDGSDPPHGQIQFPHFTLNHPPRRYLGNVHQFFQRETSSRLSYPDNWNIFSRCFSFERASTSPFTAERRVARL